MDTKTNTEQAPETTSKPSLKKRIGAVAATAAAVTAGALGVYKLSEPDSPSKHDQAPVTTEIDATPTTEIEVGTTVMLPEQEAGDQPEEILPREETDPRTAPQIEPQLIPPVVITNPNNPPAVTLAPSTTGVELPAPTTTEQPLSEVTYIDEMSPPSSEQVAVGEPPVVPEQQTGTPPVPTTEQATGNPPLPPASN